MSGFQSPRGLRDIREPDASVFAWAEEHAWSAALAAGYARIQLPVAEDSALFERAIGGTSDVVTKELYRLAVRSEESTPLALRPEVTAGVVRAYLQHGMRSEPQPVRLVTVAELFRHDRPQKGRYRQFTQFDIEAIGDAGSGIDIEVIELGTAYLRSVGLRDIEVHLNSVGCPTCRPGYLVVLAKHFAAVADRLSPVDQARLEENPLRLLDSKDEVAVAHAKGAPRFVEHLCADCTEHDRAVREGLSIAGVTVVDAPHLVRGLDYYTKTAWEYLLPGEQGQQGALGGGGRYDGLVELLGGPATPGVGFAIGIDRVVLALQERGLAPAPQRPPAVVVCGIEPGSVGMRIAIASELRAAGVSARADVSTRKIGKQLESAVRDTAIAVIIVEPDGSLSLRDLAAGSQAEPGARAMVVSAAAQLARTQGGQ